MRRWCSITRPPARYSAGLKPAIERGRLTIDRSGHLREVHPDRRRTVRLMPWSTPFEDPIALPDGRKLLTLRGAATCITKLPKAEQDLEIWQIAVEHLILAAETGGGWTGWRASAC